MHATYMNEHFNQPVFYKLKKKEFETSHKHHIEYCFSESKAVRGAVPPQPSYQNPPAHNKIDSVLPRRFKIGKYQAFNVKKKPQDGCSYFQKKTLF